MKKSYTAICKYCGRPVYSGDRIFRGQASHTQCIKDNPPDINIHIGDFRFVGYSELISNKKKIRKWWSSVGQKLLDQIDFGRLDKIDILELEDKMKRSKTHENHPCQCYPDRQS